MHATTCKITDATLLALKHAKYLREVDFSECSKITDVGVKSLVNSCNNLEILHLVECAQVTEEAIAKLEESKSLEHVYYMSQNMLE